MTFLDDPKWVNDYAVALVIEKLKAEIGRLERVLGILEDRKTQTPRTDVLNY
jgi:hypothetical protein